MFTRILTAPLDSFLRNQLNGDEGTPPVDFTRPHGEPSLTEADSVSWRVFRNPVSLFIGGITAVLLELAEPRVRSGVWDHTSFRTDPLKRMRRTGLAAMVTVYGARSVAERMISGVRRMHDGVNGITPAGVSYRANDPELLRWVHATAVYGFMEAYHRFVKKLSQAERDRFVAEGAPIALLYGATAPPASEAELQALLETMTPRLERSEIVFQFLDIMRGLRLVPWPFRFITPLMVRAAIGILPSQVREILGLSQRDGLPPGAAGVIRLVGSFVDRLKLPSSPAVQSLARLDLPLSRSPGPGKAPDRSFRT